MRRDPEADRWVMLVATSPSGKTLFSCRCCGRVSPTPDKGCKTYADPTETWKCSAWRPPQQLPLGYRFGVAWSWFCHLIVPTCAALVLLYLWLRGEL